MRINSFLSTRKLISCKDTGFYLILVAPDYEDEIYVTKDTSLSKRLSDNMDKVLHKFIKSFERTFTDNGREISDWKIYESEEKNFVKYCHNAIDQSEYAISYYTVHNHQTFTFSIWSYNGVPITKEQEVIIKNLVDSAEFSGTVFEGFLDFLTDIIGSIRKTIF